MLLIGACTAVVLSFTALDRLDRSPISPRSILNAVSNSSSAICLPTFMTISVSGPSYTLLAHSHVIPTRPPHPTSLNPLPLPPPPSPPPPPSSPSPFHPSKPLIPPSHPLPLPLPIPIPNPLHPSKPSTNPPPSSPLRPQLPPPPPPPPPPKLPPNILHGPTFPFLAFFTPDTQARG